MNKGRYSKSANKNDKSATRFVLQPTVAVLMLAGIEAVTKSVRGH